MFSSRFRRRTLAAAPGQGTDPQTPDDAPPPPRVRWVVHPVLIAMFPIVSLYAHNVHETAPASLLIPLLAVVAATLILWTALWVPARDVQRAALGTSLIVALFFAFNHVNVGINTSLDHLSWLWVHRDHHVHPAIILALLTTIAVPLFVLIFRRRRNPAVLTRFLNVFALILIGLPTASAVREKLSEPARPIIRRSGDVATAKTLDARPDVYFIVLDAYARSDVMKEVFGYDNSEFLKHLEKKGFYIGRDSTSNYCMTTLSLCSILNFQYIDDLIDPKTSGIDPLTQLIRDNLVAKTLRPHGYKFIAFATGYDQTECGNADEYLTPRHPANNFQMMLIRMTPLRFLPMKAEIWDFYTSIRERIDFALDRLPEIAEDEAPTFTFAHLLCPHHPFVFGENGEDISPRERGAAVTGGSRHNYFGGPKAYLENYPRQAKYLTRRIEQTIDRILEKSATPPIIILQSDHGSGYRHHLESMEKTDIHERMSILNCYYFPGARYERLYPSITPVNSFRVVLDTFFGADLPLLKDRNFFSTYDDPYTVTDVTERLHSGRDKDRNYTAPSFYPGLVH